MTERFDDPEDDDPHYDPDDPAQFDPKRPKKRRTYDEILGRKKPATPAPKRRGGGFLRLVLTLALLGAAGFFALLEIDCAHLSTLAADPGILCP